MTLELLFTLILTLLFGAYFFWQFSKKEGGAPREDNSFLLLQNQLNELQRSLDNKLGESNKVLREQFGESAKIIRDITSELVKVNEGQKQVVSVADQLKSLQDILKNPKQRGVLGEYYLEAVLKNVLPPGTYELQYKFKDGATVDAVIQTRDGLVPIDSKFSLENYTRILEARDQDERARYENAFAVDLKMRIDETAKYIRPEEGTLDFAFMFIPSEAVYYDLLINKVGTIKSDTVSLVEYAAGKKKVIVVSPTTLFAYFQTVLQGLKALHLEEATKKIGERVLLLQKHLMSYEEYMKKLGVHLGTTVNMYSLASKEYKKIDKDMLKITGEEMGVELPVIDRPQEEEG